MIIVLSDCDQMPEQRSELTRASLPDGQVIWLRAEMTDTPVDVGLSDALSIDGFVETLQGVTANVRAGLQRVRPDQVSVEFGIEFALGKEGLLAALAGVSGKATIKVTAVWRGEDNEPVAAGQDGEDQPDDDEGEAEHD